MTRIEETLSAVARRPNKGFIPFITAGDPSPEGSADLGIALGEGCADVLEIGVPFSDPVADGPVIQRSSLRALERGMDLDKILGLVRRIRLQSSVPVVLFSYFNPLLQYGLDRLAGELRQAGVDGVLITDLPPEEAGAYLGPFRREELDTVFLASPTTTPARMKRIADVSRGFIYLISRAGVTGAREDLAAEIPQQIAKLRQASSLPVAVGFGVSSPEHVRRIWDLAEAAVVGSALVKKVEDWAGADRWLEKTVAYARWLKGDIEDHEHEALARQDRRD